MGREDYIGLRVARWRDTSGMTQQQLADAVGISREYVSMIENGNRPITKRRLLYSIAHAVGCKVEDLTDQPRMPRDRAELAAYRAAPDIRRALDEHPTDLPNPPSVPEVAERARQAHQARMSCAYVHLAMLLPGLIRDTRALAEHPATETAGRALFVRAAFAGSTGIKSLGHVDLSMRLPERAHDMALRLGRPSELAAAEFAVAQAALTGGSQRYSSRIAATAAGAIGDRADGQMGVWYGMHALHAALSAASLDQAAEAADWHAQARDALRRVGPGDDTWLMEFTPANVATWLVAIALENGEPHRAPEFARRVNRAELRYPQRRCRLLIDAGRGHYLAGDPTSAVDAFLEADQIAPAELRSRPAVREIVGQMCRDAGPRSGSPRLATLAQRVGVDPTNPDDGT